MAGSMDWHGWGYMTDVWTVLKAAPGGNLKEVLDKKPETRVLVYRRQQSSSPLRFILEPFYALSVKLQGMEDTKRVIINAVGPKKVTTQLYPE